MQGYCFFPGHIEPSQYSSLDSPSTKERVPRTSFASPTCPDSLRIVIIWCYCGIILFLQRSWIPTEPSAPPRHQLRPIQLIHYPSTASKTRPRPHERSGIMLGNTIYWRRHIRGQIRSRCTLGQQTSRADFASKLLQPPFTRFIGKMQCLFGVLIPMILAHMRPEHLDSARTSRQRQLSRKVA